MLAPFHCHPAMPYYLHLIQADSSLPDKSGGGDGRRFVILQSEMAVTVIAISTTMPAVEAGSCRGKKGTAMQMRPSTVLKKLRAGETVLCYKTNLADARSTEIAARAGFDCVWTCMEHVPNGWSAIEQQVWAAKAHDTDLLVRVSRGSYSDYIRPLEMDAAGIMVPHCMSAEDARSIVRITRFHPIGRRPVDGGNADGGFCGIDFVEYIKQANEQRFVILQIEDPEPMQQLDEIAAVEGYDMLFFGPGDYSHGLGIPAQFDDPRIVEARLRIAQVANQHGKFAGTMGTPDNVQELVDIGYRFVNVGADVVALMHYCRGLISRCPAHKR